MHDSIRRTSILAAIVGAALLAVLPASATAASTPAGVATRTTVAVPAPAPIPAGASASVHNNGATAHTGATAPAALFCSFTTNGDFVHVSSSALEASGHGWWINGDCDTTTAVVTVQLQEFFSDGTWRNKGTVGRATVRSGGGSANRSTGRASCSNTSVTGWRSVVDVDLVGLADDPGKLTTSAQNIGCRQ